MKKRALSLLLTAAMGMTFLTGCGDSATDMGNTNADASASQEAGTAQGDPDKIIMTFVVIGNTPEDLPKVQEAVNEISVPAINVEVELKSVQIAETFSNYSLWVGSGEQIDLMAVCYSGLSTYINSGLIEPLDDLIAANAPTLSALIDEVPITEGGMADNEIYGLTAVGSQYGFQGGVLLRTEYLDEIDFEEKDVYTLADLTDIYKQIKEKHPEMYCGPTQGGGSTNSNFYGLAYDTMGATAASGVLMDISKPVVSNLFEEEAYYEYLKVMREWYEDGLTMIDAATTDVSGAELLAARMVPGYAMSVSPGYAEGAQTQYGGEFKALALTEGYRPAISSASSCYWTVPISSANPDAAIRFLNLMYEDHELANLLSWGIEGYNYTMSDTENVIEMDPDHYYKGEFCLWGDNRYVYLDNPLLTMDRFEEFTARCAANTSVAAGYGYDSSKMQNQLIAIQSVLDEYLPSLETGSTSDLEGTYQEFISKLKDAGIDDVIADNQAQLDAWLAQQN